MLSHLFPRFLDIAASYRSSRGRPRTRYAIVAVRRERRPFDVVVVVVTT